MRKLRQTGAMYVEAAIVLPVLLLVTFVSIFFFLVAARHFSLQMLANEIAKDISLALQSNADVNTATTTSSCMEICRSNNRPTTRTLDLSDYLSNKYQSNKTNCWNNCASSQFLLTTQAGSDNTALRVNAFPAPVVQWYDETLVGVTTTDNLAVGDFFLVELKYPLNKVLGGRIPFFGLVSNGELTGTAVGIMDKRDQAQ